MKSDAYLQGVSEAIVEQIKGSQHPLEEAQDALRSLQSNHHGLSSNEIDRVKQLILEGLERPEVGRIGIRKDASAKAYLQMMNELRALLGGS